MTSHRTAVRLFRTIALGRELDRARQRYDEAAAVLDLAVREALRK